jgi:hypothetical protein
LPWTLSLGFTPKFAAFVGLDVFTPHGLWDTDFLSEGFVMSHRRHQSMLFT